MLDDRRTRVWDSYLTSRDRAHVAKTTRHREFPGLGHRPAVLSVDNYRGAIGDEREDLLTAIDKWPASTGLAGWEALTHISRLLAAARSAQLPVVHVTGLPSEQSGMGPWRIPRGSRNDDPQSLDRHRRRYDIVEQAAPLPGEVVLRKTSPSAFFGTPLLSYLVGEGIDTLIMCGQTVSGCVRATAVDGCSSRLKMIVVEECVYDRHQASWAINLFDIDQKYGHVVPLDLVIDEIETLRSPD